jgi:DNA-binding CsgD family transcriptional regulator
MNNERLSLGLNEQLIIGLFTAIVGGFTAWDIFGDYKTGSSVSHLFLEGLIVITSIVFLSRTIYFLSQRNAKTYKELLDSQKEALLLRADNQKYREESKKHLAGISELIDKQFADWQLTHSEKEVALLLLKGLSHKEIADIRSTSEKTARQQAAQVYEKAKLEGRAQLSAFFLEDLLLPKM